MLIKDEELKRFIRYEVLRAAALNKKIENAGSIGGLVPYNADLEIDKFMQFDIGAKESPFGNAYFKGFNTYTTAEVLAFADAGLLTENDRMLFINMDTNVLNFWNGTAIVPVGGGSSMDYLFGTGEDGDMSIVADTSYGRLIQATNFTVNAGVTVTPDAPKHPLVIKATGKIEINGTIHANGYGFGPGEGYFTNANFTADNTFDLMNVRGGAAGGFGGVPEDSRIIYNKLISFNLNRIPLFGGGGGNAYGVGIPGGAGGGAVLLFAKNVVVNGLLTVNGTTGSTTSSSTNTGGAGGGGGGLIVIISSSLEYVENSILANGGAGGYGRSTGSNPGGSGGVLNIPNKTGTPGGTGVSSGGTIGTTAPGCIGISGGGGGTAAANAFGGGGGGGSAGQIIWIKI